MPVFGDKGYWNLNMCLLHLFLKSYHPENSSSKEGTMAATCLMNDRKRKSESRKGPGQVQPQRHDFFQSHFHHSETYFLQLGSISCFSSSTNDAITLWIHQWINPLTRSTAPESKNLWIVCYLALEPQTPNPQTWGCVWLISYSSHSRGEG